MTGDPLVDDFLDRHAEAIVEWLDKDELCRTYHEFEIASDTTDAVALAMAVMRNTL
jgi:hypothetical protein